MTRREAPIHLLVNLFARPRIRRIGVALALGAAAACTSAPPLPPSACLRVDTIPAGAKVTMRSGEVLQAPATVTCDRGQSVCIEVSFPGHVTRKVVLEPPAGERSRLSGLGVCGLVHLLENGGEWERVPAEHGRVVVALEPDEAPAGR